MLVLFHQTNSVCAIMNLVEQCLDKVNGNTIFYFKSNIWLYILKLLVGLIRCWFFQSQIFTCNISKIFASYLFPISLSLKNCGGGEGHGYQKKTIVAVCIVRFKMMHISEVGRIIISGSFELHFSIEVRY